MASGLSPLLQKCILLSRLCERNDRNRWATMSQPVRHISKQSWKKKYGEEGPHQQKYTPKSCCLVEGFSVRTWRVEKIDLRKSS